MMLIKKMVWGFVRFWFFGFFLENSHVINIISYRKLRAISILLAKTFKKLLHAFTYGKCAFIEHLKP